MMDLRVVFTDSKPRIHGPVRGCSSLVCSCTSRVFRIEKSRRASSMNRADLDLQTQNSRAPYQASPPLFFIPNSFRPTAFDCKDNVDSADQQCLPHHTPLLRCAVPFGVSLLLIVLGKKRSHPPQQQSTQAARTSIFPNFS